MDRTMIAKAIAEALLKKGTKSSSGLVLILDEYTIVRIVEEVLYKAGQDPSL